MSVVDDYLAALNAQDWDRLAATLAEDGVVRNGPFDDVVEGKEAYVDFLKKVVPSLADYRVTPGRVTSGADGLYFAEFTESFDLQGEKASYPELCIFGTDADGLICFVSVFMKHPEGTGVVEGARAD